MRGFGLACAGLLCLSCLRDDPDHCANRDGNATCQELGMGEFCSICASANAGCVESEPSDACRGDASPIDASTSTTSVEPSTGTSEASTSSVDLPPTCMTCPDDLPYCVAGECNTCDAGPPELCGEIDASLPACHAQWGRCVECTQGDTSACTSPNAWCGLDFACGGCTEHAQCPDSACDLERGVCLDDAPVLHVDNDVCPNPGAGTLGDPYCSLAVAIEQIPSEGSGTIVLHGSATPYDEGIIVITEPPRTVAVIGVDNPTISIAGDGLAVNVYNGFDVYVSGLTLWSALGTAAQCSGTVARLWIDDSRIINSGDGVVVEQGTMTLRRVRVVDNEGSGVQVSNGGELSVVASVIANNGADGEATHGLYAQAATFDVRYSTIASNRSSLASANVNCMAGGSGLLRSSVVVSPELDSIDCSTADIQNSVIDSTVMSDGDNVVVDAFDATWFRNVDISDFHVVAPSSSPFADVARWQLGDPRLDLDGEPRLTYPGATGFAGADEP